MKTTSNVPPIPKAFASQIPRLPEALRVGTERKVIILSDALGVTLNRGLDGVVRVLTVAPDTQGAKHIRRGEINSGDIIREAAGIDLRRPLTNVMWSDTVALMKMAPRPLHITVAKELSEIPPAIQEQILKAKTTLSAQKRPDPPRGYDPPSRASGMESVNTALTGSNDMQDDLLTGANIENEDLLLPFPSSPREKSTIEEVEFLDNFKQADSQDKGVVEGENRQYTA